MRCRKVRSYLSAYSNDELTGRKQLAVREHLSICQDCRAEEAIYNSISEFNSEMPKMKVSDDFNNKLLNRIGQERFSETRTKAFFPRREPLSVFGQVVQALAIRKAVPVVITTALVLLTVTAGLNYNSNQPAQFADNTQPEDQRWLTATPVNNPNVTGSLSKDWSLMKQLQSADKMARLSNTITNNSFSKAQLAGSINNRGPVLQNGIPFVIKYYRTQPVITIYQVSPKKVGSEDEDLF